MRYEELASPPPLDRFIECLWILERSGVNLEVAEDRILPDGCMELIVHYGDRFERWDPDRGSGVLQPRAFVIGEIRRPVFLRQPALSGVLGVRFRPGGVSPFFGAAASDLVGETVSLDSVWGSAGRILEERVREATGDRERVAVVVDTLRKRLEDARRRLPPPWIEEAVRLVRETRGSQSPLDFAKEVGVGVRMLERGFRSHVGMSPKLLSRVARFRAFMDRWETDRDQPWALRALDGGYYDQAHLIREFREFAQTTPSRLLRNRDSLTDCFLSASVSGRDETRLSVRRVQP